MNSILTDVNADRFSPSNYVANWSTPQLIIHSSKDYRLPDTEGIGAFHALQQCVVSLVIPLPSLALSAAVANCDVTNRQGIPSRLVIFPDENHWVLNHGNSLKWHFEVFRWFERFVGEGRGKERKAP